MEFGQMILDQNRGTFGKQWIVKPARVVLIGKSTTIDEMSRSHRV